MTEQPSPKPELDEAALAFAEQVFESARTGDAQRLADLLGRGLPANIRNHNGDSLLMLTSYHGHLEASIWPEARSQRILTVSLFL